jgi:adenylate kinase family enzyme
MAIIVIGGIPGTGKSTLANGLSMNLNIPVFSKDELEATIARTKQKRQALFKNT